MTALHPPLGASLSLSEQIALRMVAVAPLISLATIDREYQGPIGCLLKHGLLEYVTTRRRGLDGDLIGVSSSGATVVRALTGLPILVELEPDLRPLQTDEAAAMAWMRHLSWQHLSSVPARLHNALSRLEARGHIESRRLTDNMGATVEYRRIPLMRGV
ncbi:hypothetical protein [Chelatococcus asaccharovorans]|uniref:Uncharacterized protein n=1 Tax=Chelatococcus asaccharovorans TaxID=28210 RepID=A0A2V3UAH5_9HYPH|nr:hypothetical protein [Chelatococcus asaccharovorans]MBS7703195.1 hypothetical protein [Chelatococcus asaccharovorans]PXW61524.1 hypothetical protein C7450_10339 [Chelatococcus asaccharovorans]